MSAKGVISGSSLKALKVLQDAQEFFLEEKERTEGEISELLKAVQAFNDKVPFRAELLKPKTFSGFLSFTNPTQPMFNQLASEIPWWILLTRLREVVFSRAVKLKVFDPSLLIFGRMKWWKPPSIRRPVGSIYRLRRP